MRLLICLITYNRLEYTKRTLKNLKETISVPYCLIVSDNGSTDGTTEWLKELPSFMDKYDDIGVELNNINLYPGRACNIGWAAGIYYDPTHLMRLDNDMEFEPDWAEKALEYFEAIPVLGQLGLDNTALDTFNGDKRYLTTVNGKTINAWPGNLGGPCIIRREVYDRGARYDEAPWKDERTDPSKMITPQEDVKFSLSMHNYGYIYGHPTEKLAQTFATPETWGDYKEYYKKTMSERGYDVSNFSG